MPNNIYPKWREAVMQHLANSSLTGTVRAVLVDTSAYTYSPTHEFVSSLAGQIGAPQTLTAKTFLNAVFDAADVVVPAVTGATAEAIVIYIDTGVPATSRLVVYIDTAVTGLPFTPNGGDANIQWNAAGIFQLGGA